MPTGALAPDEDQTPGGDPSRGRRGVREDSGNPVSDRGQQSAAAEPASEAAARVSEEEAVPHGDAGAAVAAQDEDAGEAADAAPAGKSPRSRNTRRKAHRHTPRSQKAV